MKPKMNQISDRLGLKNLNENFYILKILSLWPWVLSDDGADHNPGPVYIMISNIN